MLSYFAAGLSFPLTLLWCLRRCIELQKLPKSFLQAPHIRIVAAGCTHRLEQRILQESNYFHELTSYFPSSCLQLCMVGPEIKPPSSKSKHGSTKKPSKAVAWVHASERFSWCLQRSTVRKFLQVCCGSLSNWSAIYLLLCRIGHGSQHPDSTPSQLNSPGLCRKTYLVRRLESLVSHGIERSLVLKVCPTGRQSSSRTTRAWAAEMLHSKLAGHLTCSICSMRDFHASSHVLMIIWMSLERWRSCCVKRPGSCFSHAATRLLQ